MFTFLKSYGKVEVRLKELTLEKNVSRNKLATLIAVNYDLINRYYNNRVIRMDLDIISSLFYALDCNELLVYKK